ncbi:hypothetical protein RvY_04907-1 [Ramazzottius varieornatus]|uniref:Sulfatase N-terminal domain-containing protein n=1 Tax=Ramazzottius varieornatus TaxID=947166 RepID=A0A1D1UT71_RAMVA|nr:hypothetical protein RvY_04907-1 [Ramazzottius varieornatus]
MMACASVLTFIPLGRRATISGYSERKVSWSMRVFPFLILPFLLHSTIKLTTASETAADSATKAKPNIVYILADDMGWNDVSFHGYNEIPTPNIDALAKKGVIMNSYYAQYMCTPSRSALLTGKYPIRNGLQHYVLRMAEPRGLDPTQKILPQYLREQGYATHMIGKWHVGYYKRSMTPTSRGFDTFFGYYAGSSDYYNYTTTAGVPPEYVGFDLWDNLTPARQYIGQYATEVYTEKAVDRIDNHNYDKPLFLYLAHFAPHWANKYDSVQAPEKYIKRFPNIKNEGRRKYAATMAALDDSVGAVVQALQAKNVLDNTIIVFASDNGGAGAEQELLMGKPVTFASNWPLKGAKTSQWEGGVRVPCVVSSPLLEKQGYISNELYHITDWLPTFVQLAGGSVTDSEVDGKDIWKSLSQGLPSPRKEVLIQADPVWDEYAIRWNQFKLVVGSYAQNGNRIDQWYEPEGGLDVSLIIDTPGALICDQTAALGEKQRSPCDAAMSPCLFDVVTDPCELRNLAEERPDMVGFLYEKIREFNRTALPSDNLPLDPRAKAALNDFLIQPYLD